MKKKETTSGLSVLQSVLAKVSTGVKEGRVLTGEQIEAAALTYQTTGLVELDEILNGGKGMPKGAFIEVNGAENAGKSHLIFHAAKYVQARPKNNIVVLIDVENRYSTHYLLNEMGLQMDKLIIIKPDSAEEVLESMLGYINDENIGMIGVDTVGSLLTTQELEGELTDANIGAQARLVTRWSSRGSKKQTNPNSPTVFCANQLRDNVGGGTYAKKTKTPGGRGYGHVLMVRINIRAGEKIESKGKVIGHVCHFKLEKNAVGPAFGECEVPLYYGHGFSSNESYEKLLTKKNSKYFFQLTEKKKGEIVVTNYSLSQSELFQWLKNEPKKAIKLWDQLHGRKIPKSSAAASAEVNTETSTESQDSTIDPMLNTLDAINTQ